MRASQEDRQVLKTRSALTKKPKVKPVKFVNKVKQFKNTLRSKAVIGASKKINMEDDESSSDEEDEANDENVFMGDQSLPSMVSKVIKKKGFSRAHYTEMKREVKRRAKSGASGTKRRVEKLREIQSEFKAKVLGTSTKMEM